LRGLQKLPAIRVSKYSASWVRNENFHLNANGLVRRRSARNVLPALYYGFNIVVTRSDTDLFVQQ